MKKVMSSRRSFMQGSAVVLTSLSAWTVPTFFATENQQAQVVIYQDKAHFDNSGLLQPYLPPSDPASSTRRYVESLEPIAFMSRHWFS